MKVVRKLVESGADYNLQNKVKMVHHIWALHDYASCLVMKKSWTIYTVDTKWRDQELTLKDPNDHLVDDFTTRFKIAISCEILPPQ